MARKSRIRIRGVDRALMMLCRDIRRRWNQYDPQRKALSDSKSPCVACKKPAKEYEIDHVEPIGKRPYVPEDLPAYFRRFFELPQQKLCKTCHDKKSSKERKKNG